VKDFVKSVIYDVSRQLGCPAGDLRPGPPNRPRICLYLVRKALPVGIDVLEPMLAPALGMLLALPAPDGPALPDMNDPGFDDACRVHDCLFRTKNITNCQLSIVNCQLLWQACLIMAGSQAKTRIKHLAAKLPTLTKKTPHVARACALAIINQPKPATSH